MVAFLIVPQTVFASEEKVVRVGYDSNSQFIKESDGHYYGYGVEYLEKIAEYTIVIDGDLDGDSVCDALDIALTEMSMNGNKVPSAIECYAANGMSADEININSFQYVVNTALE